MLWRRLYPSPALPCHTSARRGRVQALQAEADAEEALATLPPSLAPAGHLWLGRARLAQAHWHEAAAAFEAVLRLTGARRRRAAAPRSLSHARAAVPASARTQLPAGPNAGGDPLASSRRLRNSGCHRRGPPGPGRAGG